MELKERLSYLQEMLLYNNQIFSWCYRDDFSLVHSNCTWETVLKNLFLLESSTYLKKFYPTQDSQPLYFTDSLDFSWFVVPFHSGEEISYYILGPVFTNEISETYFRNRMNMKQMSISSQGKLIRILKDIPMLPMMHFVQIGGMLYYTLYKTRLSIPKLHTKKLPLPELDSAEAVHVSPITHGSYALETQILNDVENGNINYADTRVDIPAVSLDNHVTGTLCPGDPLRQRKDELLIYTALVTRAAMRGGMLPEAAYTLSDFYCQAIESCVEILEIQNISQLMYDDFIHKVHDIKKTPELSPVIKDCMVLINKNITRKIDITEISEVLGYSPYYLSAQFKKQTGVSIKSYITNQKIEFAKLQLKNTDIDIAEISDSLSFSSPSYFTAIFKNAVGITPKEYRKQT